MRRPLLVRSIHDPPFDSNILVDGDGHILHIDLGFMLSPSNSPGGGINFERAPFKLTSEYLEVLGGADSDMLQYAPLRP